MGVQRRSCNFSHRENDAVQIQPILTNQILFFDFSSCLHSSWVKILSFFFLSSKLGFVKKGGCKNQVALKKFQFMLQFFVKDVKH